MKLFFTLLGILIILQSCETPPTAQSPNTQNPNNQSSNEQGVIIIEIPTDLNTQSTEWIFSSSKNVRIPDFPIDSIIFQAPVRSVYERPGAEAILFDVDENRFINSSIVISNVRYTILNYRSQNLKGYFNSQDYVLRVGLRSQDTTNAASIPYDCKLIIYHQL